MARTGRPPKPTEQKRRTGTLRPDRLPKAVGLAVVPAIEPAEHELSVAEAMDRVLSRGVVWLAATDTPTVCLLRDTLDLYAELREDPKSRTADVLAANKRVSELLTQLGFDPTARSRLGLAEVKAASKLEEIRRRRDQPISAAAVADQDLTD